MQIIGLASLSGGMLLGLLGALFIEHHLGRYVLLAGASLSMFGTVLSIVAPLL